MIVKSVVPNVRYLRCEGLNCFFRGGDVGGGVSMPLTPKLVYFAFSSDNINIINLQ